MSGLKHDTEAEESVKIGRGALHKGRSSTGRSCGLYGRENAGMSSENEVESSWPNIKVSRVKLICPG